MLFNSMQFLVFFPIVALLYYIVPAKYRYIWLCLVNYYFYMCWNPKFALLIGVTTLITYGCGLAISKGLGKKKFWVTAAFVSNLGILVFFKYFDFVMDNINVILSKVGLSLIEPTFSILLPVGISFYTFQALGYVVDVYRGKVEAEKNILRYTAFISFFPNLISGPIERSTNLLAQMKKKIRFDFEQVKMGLLLMLWGYFLKLVITDRIAIFVNQVYDNYQEYAGIPIFLATVLYAIQIYCDFNSYSCLAMGAAKVMGFDLIENFNTPYFAVSVSDFWRRWHISLSSWFRDYLYIPLGGNRKGAFRKYLNIMIVFLVSGLWHGASWNYIIWGGLNGAFQVIGAVLKPVRDKVVFLLHIDRESLGHKAYKILTTFLLIDFTWIFFRANGARNALQIMKRMFSEWNPWVLFDGSLYELGLDAKDFGVLLFALLIILVVGLCKFRGIRIREIVEKQWLPIRWICYLVAIFFVLIYGVYGPAYDAGAFIYFQF